MSRILLFIYMMDAAILAMKDQWVKKPLKKLIMKFKKVKDEEH